MGGRVVYLDEGVDICFGAVLRGVPLDRVQRQEHVVVHELQQRQRGEVYITVIKRRNIT